MFYIDVYDWRDLFFSINGLSNTTVISSKIGATATLTTLLTTLETISEGVKK